MALTFTDADSAVHDLDDGTIFKQRSVRNAGIPPVEHDTVRTPSRDGETYIDTFIPPRFLIVQLVIQGTSWANLLANRRTLVQALNPTLGVGTLKWTPDATVYAIDCILERGVGFSDNRGPKRENATISLRCPDATWYNPTANTPTVAGASAGLGVPVEVPVDIEGTKGSAVINNTGDVESFPVITLPGPFQDPTITNVTTGKKVRFVGLTVLNGETLTIDHLARTAKVGSTSHISKLSADSEMWPLATGNNTATSARVTFPTPTGNPTIGAGLQEFKALVRPFDAGQTGDPNARLELWENGVLVRAGSDTVLQNAGGDILITLTWDANELGTADGSLVECNFVGTKTGGSGSKRNTVDIGAVEWNVDYTAGGPTPQAVGDATPTPVGALLRTTLKPIGDASPTPVSPAPFLGRRSRTICRRSYAPAAIAPSSAPCK